MIASVQFDYLTATEPQILDLASELPGMALGDIPGSHFASDSPEQGRAEAGLAIEAYFGIPPNPNPWPDFPEAGIELKSVPLIEKSVGLRVDQRTVISQIDYFALAEEAWETASVRKKLDILFVFFERLRDPPKEEWPVVHVALWRPHDIALEGIRIDWEQVKSKVINGKAHELSEADGRILGPCTKGAGGGEFRRQPFSDLPAKPRAWALKQAFVLGVYEQSRSSAPDYGLLTELAQLTHLLGGLRSYRGRAIDDVADELKVRRSRAKDYAARVVHRLAGSMEPEAAQASGTYPAIRAPRTSPEGEPYEAVSFPAFRHMDLADETWDDSELLGNLEHLLFIPVVGAQRDTPQGSCRVGPPVYWRPTADQLAGIAQEWQAFHDLISAGNADKLPSARQTRYIHVRPHGRNAADRDATPGGGSETKKSFWLNKPFIAEILSEVLPGG